MHAVEDLASRPGTDLGYATVEDGEEGFLKPCSLPWYGGGTGTAPRLGEFSPACVAAGQPRILDAMGHDRHRAVGARVLQRTP